MKSFKLLASTLILGAVLTACSSDSVSGNFKAKNEYQEKALKLVAQDRMGKRDQTLSYEEIKAKYNIPTNAKICKTKEIFGYKYSIAFTDNKEDYENFLKSGKYDRIYIPIFYVRHMGDNKTDSFAMLEYDDTIALSSLTSIISNADATEIDPKTCE